MFLQLISPAGIIFRGEVSSVTLPGESGAFTILPRHAPIISILTAGNVKYVTTEGEVGKVAVVSGFVEVNDNKATVCVELKNQENQGKQEKQK